MNKLPKITIAFWIMKICATTLGETAGDMLSMTFQLGYALSSILLVSFFIVTLLTQLFSKKHHPFVYWMVILSTSTAGTTISDYMDRTLGFGYATGALLLLFLLLSLLWIWKKTEKSIAVDSIISRRAEIFYWMTILVSNTLGTALGDYLAEDSGLGFMNAAIIIGIILLILILLYYFTDISAIFLFWVAFVLTRPFGATFGDLLTKSSAKGGLNLGTMGSSFVLMSILMVLIFVSIKNLNRNRKAELS